MGKKEEQLLREQLLQERIERTRQSREIAEANQQRKFQAEQQKKIASAKKNTLFKKGVISKFSKPSLQTQKRFTSGAVGIAKGLGLIQQNVRGAGGNVGRPQGPSGKYYIPGKGPVGVYEYRKYVSYQNRLKAMQGGNAQLTQQQIMQKIQRQQMAMQIQSQQPMPQEMSRQQFQQPQQQVVREPRVNLADNSMNILNAPSFMKGEMIKKTNVETPIITMAPRPIANPGGQEYMDIDPASGRPIMMRRITEKWMTGEAL